MLHDLPVVDPKDIDDGAAQRARLDDLVHVQNHEVTIDEYALGLAVRPRRLLRGFNPAS